MKDLSLCVILLCACNRENSLNSIKNPNDNSGVEIEVTPSSLTYGTLTANDQPVVQGFTVTSIGVDQLDVTSIEIIGENASSFTIVSPETTFVLLPNESRQVDVAFMPLDANQISAQAVVASNAYNASNVEVALVGQGIIGALDISPDPLDVGDHYLGCSADNQLTISNVGSEVVEITEISHIGTDFTLISGDTLPLSLQPEEGITVGLNFIPMSQGVVEGELTVVSNEPMGRRNASQTGQGLVGDQITQEWIFAIDPPSDILFAVDGSGSMSDNMSQLGSNFGDFISQLSNYSTDWQIMVTGGDTGCNVGGIITPSTANYETIFQNAARCKDFLSGSPYTWDCDAMGSSYTEGLLTEARNAIEGTDSSECNDGFLRSDAMLHIILVSDEPEQSIDIPSQGMGETWQGLADQIIAKKGSIGLVRISAIVGDLPNGCQSGGLFGSDADAGTGYFEAKDYTNGVFLSICEDWSDPSNLQLLAQASVLLDSYPLDFPAMEGSIVVEVNEFTVNASYWTYDTSTQSVIFTSNAPSEGSTVQITYTPMGVCD